MGDSSKKGGGAGKAFASTNVSLGGIVKLANGNSAVRLKVGGQTILVPAGGGDRPNVSAIRRRISRIGKNVSASVRPQSGGKLKVGLKGDEGSISFSGQRP